MASRAITNILGGIMSGAAGAMKDRRLKREGEEAWQRDATRRREILDMQDEYGQRREDRQRQQRKTDEQEMYDLGQTRLQQLQKQQLDKIAKLYPDRWQDQKFQQDVTAGIMGIKVPALPANKAIASLAQAGKIDEALTLAFQSSNPEDRGFYQDVISAITQRKRLDMLLNPAKYQKAPRPDSTFVQGALDQGQSMAADMPASSILSAFLPNNLGDVAFSDSISHGMSSGLRPQPNTGRQTRTGNSGEDAATKAQLVRLEKLIKIVEDEAKPMLARLDDFLIDEKDKALIRPKYNALAAELQGYRDQYRRLLSNTPNIEQSNPENRGNRAAAFSAVKQLFNKYSMNDDFPEELLSPATGSKVLESIMGANKALPAPQVAQAVAPPTLATQTMPLPVASGSAAIPSPIAPVQAAPTMKRQPSAQDVQKQQQFSSLVSIISKQLNRPLSDDERGFIATGVYNGDFAHIPFNLTNGTYSWHGYSKPLSDLLTSRIGSFAEENTFQAIPDARSKVTNILSKILQGTVLTDEGSKAIREL